MNPSTKNLEKVLHKTNSENEASQVAIGNIQPATENTLSRLKARKKYEPTLKHTLATLKTAAVFFEKQERPSGDFFWKGRSVEKLGGSRLQTGEDKYHISTDIQKVISNATEDSVKKVKDTDEVEYRNKLVSLTYKNYERRRFRFSGC